MLLCTTQTWKFLERIQHRCTDRSMAKGMANRVRILLAFAAIAVVQVAGWAEATDIEPKGGGYVDTRRPKASKDYYVVKGQGDQCSIVSGDFADRPEGAIGETPYATRKYASAALKKFVECKGGEAEKNTNEK